MKGYYKSGEGQGLASFEGQGYIKRDNMVGTLKEVCMKII